MAGSTSSDTPAADLARCFRRCKGETRHHAKTFFFASHLLPAHKRDAAYAVYAFCRHADDEIDEAGGEEARKAAAERLAGLFDEIVADPEGAEGKGAWFARALAVTVERFALPRRAFVELVEGVAMDVGSVRIGTWEELRNYCYHVASTVGLIMAPIFGLRDPAGEARAIDLGIAMQLTNICRDIKEDFERDRIYLPSDELVRFGVSEGDLAEGNVNERFRDLLRFQIERARRFYDESEPGIALLDRDGSRWTVWAMRILYSEILREIEKQGYDVFSQRAHTGKGQKALGLLKAWGRARG